MFSFTYNISGAVNILHITLTALMYFVNEADIHTYSQYIDPPNKALFKNIDEENNLTTIPEAQNQGLLDPWAWKSESQLLEVVYAM